MYYYNSGSCLRRSSYLEIYGKLALCCSYRFTNHSSWGKTFTLKISNISKCSRIDEVYPLYPFSERSRVPKNAKTFSIHFQARFWFSAAGLKSIIRIVYSGLPGGRCPYPQIDPKRKLQTTIKYQIPVWYPEAIGIYMDENSHAQHILVIIAVSYTHANIALVSNVH